MDTVLDLHTFRPQEASDVVGDFLDAALLAGHTEVRIIHGKGTGQMRRTVEATLRRHPGVSDYYTAPSHLGGWGATIVVLGRRTEPWPDIPPPIRSKTPRSFVALMLFFALGSLALWMMVLFLLMR